MTTDKNNRKNRDQEEGQATYSRAKDLFLRLVDLPPEQREPLLTHACLDDPETEELVRRLLAHHDREKEQDQDQRIPGPVLPPRRCSIRV